MRSTRLRKNSPLWMRLNARLVEENLMWLEDEGKSSEQVSDPANANQQVSPEKNHLGCSSGHVMASQTA
jgi:hypothetical protein